MTKTWEDLSVQGKTKRINKIFGDADSETFTNAAIELWQKMQETINDGKNKEIMLQELKHIAGSKGFEI